MGRVVFRSQGLGEGLVGVGDEVWDGNFDHTLRSPGKQDRILREKGGSQLRKGQEGRVSNSVGDCSSGGSRGGEKGST